MSKDNDLVVTRTLDAPLDAVWRAFTGHMAEWWCPRPWTTEIVEADLRSGGRSAMVMRGPEGEEHAMEGVFLEVTPRVRVVFTDAYAKGWVPQEPFMTGIMAFEADGERTLYRGIARHWTEEARERHAAMGFAAGWEVVAEQLEAVARRIAYR